MIRVIEFYDKSKYKIVGFTPDEYKRLQDCVTNQKDPGSVDTFGFIEKIGTTISIDVTCRDYYDNGRTTWQPEWDTYATFSSSMYSEALEGGSLDISLSYDEQVKYLISELENTLRLYKFDV